MKEEGGGGCTFACIFIGTHIVSLSYRTTWRMFTNLDRDEVLMDPHPCIGFSAKSTQGRIQGGAKIGHRGVPSPKDFFFKLEGYINKPNTWQWFKSTWEEALSKVKFWRVFDVFLDLVILVYFNAISIDVYAVSAFILCNFHVYKWENA